MNIAVVRLSPAVRAIQRGAAQAPGVSWAQFGDDLLLFSAGALDEALAAAAASGAAVGRAGARSVEGELFLVVQKGRLFQQEHPDVPIALDRGRYLVAAIPAGRREAIAPGEEPCYRVLPLPQNKVVFEARTPPAERATPVPWVRQLVGRLSRSGFEADLQQLVSYPTRHSATAHYADAAAWARSRLDALGYVTQSQTVALAGGSTQNIIADKAGAGTGARDLVLVTAHLDSVNRDGGPDAPAPGADDNGSGSAGLLAIAGALAEHTAEHDLRLVLFGGEEQGLRGSAAYVAALPAADRARLRAVVNMDMIGARNTPAPTVLLEGAPVSQSLIDALAEAAATYTGLTVQTSLSPYASDHVPFIQAGLPAVLTIEGADGANDAIHTASDTLDRIDGDLAMEILRMNTAAAAMLIGRGGAMSDIIIQPDLINILPWLRFQYSGRYVYNGGASAREELRMAEERIGHNLAVLDQPIYALDEPIYAPSAISPINPAILELLQRLRFTLHIDIDGTDPLNVVSGTVARGLFLIGSPPPHFIGRVTSNTVSGGARNLVVEDFSFTWPGTSHVINRLEISLTGNFFVTPTASVTFIATATGQRYGPYTATRESPYFRDVEVEVDVEDGAVPCEPYDTHTHPDRPADLPKESLTLEKVFARAGIRITRSAATDTISTAEAGPDAFWSEQELHDAMESHWSAFANTPQWKMWIFLAERAADPGLAGIMFDGDINEPGGVDRQGTAIFTLCPHFHTAGGAYPQANPPAAEAAQRELFFDLIHETGHAFNLAHSFQKHLGAPWTPPAWMPLATNPQSLSWMNYPDLASPGSGNNATWFYNQFRFRFDDSENLFLRHAPGSFVQMGNAAWFQNHGRVARETLDRRLELRLRTRAPVVELGEAVILELRLKNIGPEPVTVHRNLSPTDGFVEVAVTNPRGERQPFVPIVHTRAQVVKQVLEPGQALYQAINLTVGQLGFPFKEPGAYRIEASFTNLDGTTAAAVMQLYVRPPSNYETLPVASELFNARVGRVLYVGGSRLMEDVNEKIDWVCQRLGPQHPTTYYLSATRAMPQAQPFKLVEAETDTVRVLPPDPELVERALRPIVQQPESAADALGHIVYRRTVDVYTDAAVECGKRAAARKAQRELLALFEQRNVVPQVVEEVKERAAELK